MGAYWAGPHYFDLLKGIDTVQYIKRPQADVRRSFGTVVEVSWSGYSEQMYFYDGCSLVDQGGRFRTIADLIDRLPEALHPFSIGKT